MFHPLTRLDQLDQYWFRRGQALAQFRPNLVLARMFSRSADGPPYALLALLCLVSNMPALTAFGWNLLTAFALELPLYVAFKHACRRERPARALPGVVASVQPMDRFSLPSGHTAAAFLVTLVVIGHAGWLGLILLPWAMAVGVSRVVLGVHYPGDVVAGAALGSLVAFAVITWGG